MHKHRVMKSGLKKENKEKIRLDVIPSKILYRIAQRFMHGAKKYGMDNWKKAKGDDMELFKQAAFRHFYQWADGELDEDHAAAALTDIIIYETLKNEHTTKNRRQSR